MLATVQPVCPRSSFRDWRNAQSKAALHQVPSTQAYLLRYDFRRLDMPSQQSRLVFDRQRLPGPTNNKLHFR